MPVQTDKFSCLENLTGLVCDEDSSTVINMEEHNILDIIQSKLTVFEERLLNDYSSRNVLPESDLRLPMLVINSFSKIFQLWHKNSNLKNSIQRKVFYDIHSLMSRSLNDAAIKNDERLENDTISSNLTGICDICDEEFEIKHNDAEKSFAEHEHTKTHIEALSLFNLIGTSDKIDDDLKQVMINHSVREDIAGKQYTNISHRQQEKFNSVLQENSCFLKLLNEENFECECYLCDIVCSTQTNLIDHCNSSMHKKYVSYFLSKSRPASKKQIKFNSDLIFSTDDSFYCMLCQCIVMRKFRVQHVNGHHHQKWKTFACKVINLREPYLRKFNQKPEMCFCELCNVEFMTTNSIVPHCQTKLHIARKQFADDILRLWFN